MQIAAYHSSLLLLLVTAATQAHAAGYSYLLRRETAECGSQGSNLGAHNSAYECAQTAGAAGCLTFMMSTEYTSWGCRCCTDPDSGNSHSLWDVYDVVDCSQVGAGCVTPASQMMEGVLAAKAFCDDPSPVEGAGAEAQYDAIAQTFSDVLSSLPSLLANDDVAGSFASSVANASDIAAQVLAGSSTSLGDGVPCSSRASGCNKGRLLLQMLRSLLALHDGNGTRAFVDSTGHRDLLDAHQILVGDGLWLSATSIDKVTSFFDALPPHLMTDGVLKDAPFATMTVKNAFGCGGTQETVRLGVTDRGFNVFQNQYGDVQENAFGSTSFPYYGDLLLTVVKHEAAHQFDRLVSADATLSSMKTAYTSAATADTDWLRNGVGNAYFQGAPQEIIASQVGNQYLLSSSNQLALALSRLTDGTSALPLAWFLFHLEVFARREPDGVGVPVCSSRDCRLETVLYSTANGLTSAYCSELGRNEHNQITRLSLPGCANLTVSYAGPAATALPTSTSPPDWSCTPDPGAAACDVWWLDPQTNTCDGGTATLSAKVMHGAGLSTSNAFSCP